MKSRDSELSRASRKSTLLTIERALRSIMTVKLVGVRSEYEREVDDNTFPSSFLAGRALLGEESLFLITLSSVREIVSFFIKL